MPPNLGGEASGESLKLVMLEAQVSTLKQQVQILTAELGMIHEGIRNQFGIPLINTDSVYYKSLHGTTLELENINESLAVPPPLLLDDIQENFDRIEEGSGDDEIGITDEIEVTPIKRESEIAADKNGEIHATTFANVLSLVALECDLAVDSAHTRDNSDNIQQVNEINGNSSGRSTTMDTKTGIIQTPATKKHKTSRAKVGISEKPHKCRHCTSCLITNRERNRHEQRVHEGRKPFKCQHCNLAFFNSGNRKRHERVHTGERPFTCRYCQAGFTSSDGRTRHERIHTGEKPFKCKFCNAAFTISAHRSRHERIHTGEKPHACEYCGKSFIDKRCLSKHLQTHTNEKPYICQTCNQSFSTSFKLGVHKNRHRHQ